MIVLRRRELRAELRRVRASRRAHPSCAAEYRRRHVPRLRDLASWSVKTRVSSSGKGEDRSRVLRGSRTPAERTFSYLLPHAEMMGEHDRRRTDGLDQRSDLSPCASRLDSAFACAPDTQAWTKLADWLFHDRRPPVWAISSPSPGASTAGHSPALVRAVDDGLESST
jgi:hypothetical protein